LLALLERRTQVVEDAALPGWTQPLPLLLARLPGVRRHAQAGLRRREGKSVEHAAGCALHVGTSSWGRAARRSRPTRQRAPSPRGRSHSDVPRRAQGASRLHKPPESAPRAARPGALPEALGYG